MRSRCYDRLSAFGMTYSTSKSMGIFYWFAMVALLLSYIIYLLRNSEMDSNRRFYTRIALAGIALFWLAAIDVQRFLMTSVLAVAAYCWLKLWFEVLKRRQLTSNPLIFILVAALLLRLPLLSDSFWYDESFTAMVSSQSLSDMWLIILSDVHPPLWYFIEHLTISILGSSELALRLPALFAGLALIPLTYQLVLTLRLPESTANIAALLIAILPAFIYYSNEARAYSLLGVTVLTMTLAVINGKRGWFMVAAVATVLLHNLGYLHVLVLGLVGLWIHRRRWFVAVLPSAIIGAAWLPFMLRQTSDISDGFWLPWSPVGSFKLLTQQTVGWHVADEYILYVYATVVALTIVAGIVCRSWLRSRQGMVLIAMMIGAPLLAAVVSYLWQPVYLIRAFLPCVVGLIILWSYALTQAYAADRRVLWIWTAPTLLIALISLYVSPAGRLPIREGIVSVCRDADAIYNSSVHVHVITDYYSDLPQLLWSEANDTNQHLTSDAKLAAQWKQGTIDQLAGTICVFDFDTLLSKDSERQHIAEIISDSSQHEIVAQNSLFTLTAHLIER